MANKAELKEQCERLGIVLGARCQADDYAAALDAYARGYAAGCEKAYHQGVATGQQLADDGKPFEPATWQEALDKLGRSEARTRFPALYSEAMAADRRRARRRG